MNPWWYALADWFGYAAGGTVLLAFSMRDIKTLRWVAIVSNLLFIVYGWLVWLPPVLVLHTILLPLNILRLAQMADAVSREPAPVKARGECVP